MKTLLNKFSVHNRENLFVFKESVTGTVFYIRLHDRASTVQTDLTEDSYSPSLKVKFGESYRSNSRRNFSPLVSSVHSTTQRTSVKLLNREFNNRVLITVHGICEPGDEIKNQLMNALDNKLRDAVLDQLLVLMERNPNFKLIAEDVQFLQPKALPPSHIWHFTLPFIALNHLFVLNYYLMQHLFDYLYEPNYSPKVDHFR
uniref:Uncharacterized protein n=1 Tax=Romanomermis culicivorax TaxID=13658 RepID=A0A915I711_ROMCU